MCIVHRPVASASWDKDELVRFWNQKVKGHGHRVEPQSLTLCMVFCSFGFLLKFGTFYRHNFSILFLHQDDHVSGKP